jgi:uncharacterized protein YehS (DUF1456 family)
MAITCLLNAYKEDFSDPPCYSILNYLIKNIPDRDIQRQAENLLEELQKDEENNQLNIDNNNNHQLLNNYIYNQKGFDYMTPWNFLDIPSTTIAEQLTIVDAVY